MWMLPASFFDELAAYCLDTAVSDGGEGFPLK